jgi:hypothetical protein
MSQDRDKEVVPLSAKGATDDDKGRAQSITHSIAGGQVVSDEMGVRPNGDERTAGKVESELDSGIDKNVTAKMLQHHLKNEERCKLRREKQSRDKVVTLKGKVPPSSERIVCGAAGKASSER